MTPRSVLVPPERVGRWFDNLAARHGRIGFRVADGRLLCRAADGTTAEAALPFGRRYDGPADPVAFAAAVNEPLVWGLLLVRRGGFAVASLQGPAVVASKVGRRHVQGRTKAGGQSQQRFARRRENQARQAFEAAGEHAHRILVTGTGPLTALVCGGDRKAVDAVLSDPRLGTLSAVRTGPWLPVPDPDRAVLTRAAADGRSAEVRVTEPG